MIASELLLPISQWLGWLLYAAVLGWALWRSPWLELFSDHPDQALERLESPRRDELEPLDDVNGLWTSDPAGVVLLVRNE